MLILSRVCADFYDRNNHLLHRITSHDLGDFRYAPDTIQEDPLFQMLVDDGSIKFPADDAKDKALEQDPYAGATAEGKDIKPKTTSKAKKKSNSEFKIQNSELQNENGAVSETTGEAKAAEEDAGSKG